MKLSIALATFNEEKNLTRCLEAIKGWADEIVVVDGNSTDKTREIAKKFGAKVIKTTNKPIFHINKQIAIDHCLGEWILQLDADEIVSAELKKEILAIIKKDKFEPKSTKDDKEKNLERELDKQTDEIVAYWISRKNFFLGRWLRKTGQYPDPVIRFFKKGKAKLPCKSVHEQMEVQGETSWLKGHLNHYPYPSFAEYLRKSNRYTSLSAQELFDKGEKPSFCGYLKAEAKGDNIKVFIDDMNKAVINYTDKDPFTHGKAGIRTEGSIAFFGNFTVAAE